MYHSTLVLHNQNFAIHDDVKLARINFFVVDYIAFVVGFTYDDLRQFLEVLAALYNETVP